ncbi:MAG: DUF58 domain-containing protein [Candidatus Sericytochromatia bacterium]
MNKELLEKIKKLQIKAKYLVTDKLSGNYESRFKGSGIEFSEVREYSSGDEVRAIDWNVTARMGHPYIKEFIEERELTIIILLDLSASQRFGSGENTKIDTAMELAYIFSCLAIKSHDKVGLLLFTDKIEKYIPPKKGKDNIWKLITEITKFEPQNNKTNISVALEYLNKVIKKKAVVFLISDFISTDDYEGIMKKVAKRHDFTAIKIYDEKELDISNNGIILFEDFETGEIIEFDSNNKKNNQLYTEFSNSEQDFLKLFFKKNKIRYRSIKNNSDYIKMLVLNK